MQNLFELSFSKKIYFKNYCLHLHYFLGFIVEKNPRKHVIGEEENTLLEYCLLQGACFYGRSCS